MRNYNETCKTSQFSRRRRRKNVVGHIIEEMARRGEKGMKIGHDEYMCIYV